MISITCTRVPCSFHFYPVTTQKILLYVPQKKTHGIIHIRKEDETGLMNEDWNNLCMYDISRTVDSYHDSFVTLGINGMERLSPNNKVKKHQ